MLPHLHQPMHWTVPDSINNIRSCMLHQIQEHLGLCALSSLSSSSRTLTNKLPWPYDCSINANIFSWHVLIDFCLSLTLEIILAWLFPDPEVFVSVDNTKRMITIVSAIQKFSIIVIIPVYNKVILLEFLIVQIQHLDQLVSIPT